MESTSTIKKIIKKPPKPIGINLTNCKYDILREISKDSNFQVVEEGSQDWMIYWIDTGVTYERILTMKTFQKINHFPGMHEICRKDHLARKVAKLSKLFPKEYNFFPQSWILPSDWNDFSNAYKPKKTQAFICKPDHGCQGKGIFLFKNPSTIQSPLSTDGVIQSYVSSPYLINGFKFDLRVYVLVTSVNPLRVFIYKDGLARFATEPYHTPTEKNISKLTMHLTNYAINKNETNFVAPASTDDDKGSKRTIKSVLKEMKELNDVNVELVWKRIKNTIVKTVISVQPALSKFPKPWFPTDTNNSLKNCGSQCFEILGFDILLDSKLKPWVLEVNHSPSFACDSILDKDIKLGVIKGALDLLNLNANSIKRYQKDEKSKSISRLTKSPSKTVEKSPRVEHRDSATTIVQDSESVDGAVIPEKHLAAIENYHKTYNPNLLEKLADLEDKKLGEYDRAFPPAEPRLLGKYLYLIQAIGHISETKGLKNKKALIAAREEEELQKKKRMEIWKIKQKSNQIQSKISMLLEKYTLDKSGVVSMKRSQHIYQLQFGDYNSTSPLPDYLTAQSSYESQKITMDHRGRQGLSMPRQDLSEQALGSTNLFNLNPIIKQKQNEFSIIQTTMNNRNKVNPKFNVLGSLK